MNRATIASFGGGVNSTAMLVGLQDRGPLPDYILFSDTGDEHKWTYRHIDFMQDWLALNHFPPITVVRESITLYQDCMDRETLPGKAFGFGSCSEHFKIRPQQKWLKAQGIEHVTWLVGFHAGEAHRRWPGAREGQEIRHPLIEWGWGQEDCRKVIELAGIPAVRKSSCTYCPSKRKAEVLQLAKEDPEEFDRCVEMERNALPTLQTIKGLGRRYSWEALAKADSEQLRLFGDEEDQKCGMCFD